MSDIRERDDRIGPGTHGDRFGPGTYMTPEEAKEFHKLFVTSFIIFTLIAIGAHVLAWMWRPWLPGEGGYQSSMIDGAQQYAAAALSFLA